MITVQLVPMLSSEAVNFLPWPQWCIEQQASLSQVCSNKKLRFARREGRKDVGWKLLGV